MQCSVCGQENPAGAQVCTRCSNPLAGQPAAVNPAPPTAAPVAPVAPMAPQAAGSVNTPKKFKFPEQSGAAEIFLGREGTSDTSLITGGLIGLFITAIWYLGIIPLFGDSYFHDLFARRGAIPYPLTFFFFWVMTMVFFKIGKMVSQRAALKMKLLPDDIQVITPDVAGYLLDEISKKVKRNPKEKILVNRVWVALQNFQHTNSLESTTDLLSYQADIDIGILETTYVMINLFIWALPIWGFLGTVLGIGGAIAGFTKVIQSSVEMSAIKDALSVVTGGLSTAFDTTLLGLVCAMIVMFVSTPLKKMEEELLSKVEEFILDNLVHRLQTVKIDLEEKPEDIEKHLITDIDQAKSFKDIINQAFKKHIDEMTGAFQAMQSGISDVMKEMVDQTSGITEKMSGIPATVQAFDDSINRFGEKIADVAKQQSDLVAGMNENLNNLSPLMDAVTRISKNLAEEREIFNKNVDSWMKNLEKLGSGITEEMSEERKMLSQNLQDWSMKLNETTKLIKDDSEKIVKLLKDNSEETVKLLKDNSDEAIKSMNESSENTLKQLGDTSDQALKQISEIGGLFQGISEKQDEIINGLGYNVEQLNNTDTQFQSALEAISNALASQDEIMGTLKTIIEQQVSSDSMFKDTLGGINQSLESMVAPLTHLAKPRKVRLVEE